MNRRTAARHRRRAWRRQRHWEERAAWLAACAEEREEWRAWRRELHTRLRPPARTPAEAARDRTARREAHRLARRLRTAVRWLSESEAAVCWPLADCLQTMPCAELRSLFGALGWTPGGEPLDFLARLREWANDDDG